jgi:predicted ATPase/DNA-binding SARP family transcriptional activator
VMRLGIAVLGPVRVTRDGENVDLGTTRHREIVAALAMSDGEPVSSSLLIDRVWGEDAPPTALATLHGYIAAIRRLLEPDRPPRAPSTFLTTRAGSYVLEVDPGCRDETRFEHLVASARSRLAVVPDHLVPQSRPQDREAVETALDELEDALALWRGTPYAELGADSGVVAHRARLDDLLRVAVELKAVGQLALGLHDVVHGDLEARTAESPLHERWWALRAVALARDSRQAEALSVLDQLRTNLVDELGVDPSPPLQDLRTAILRQAPSVTVAPGKPSPATPVSHASTRVHPSPWKLAGRDQDVLELHRTLDQAATERPAFVVLTGGPGIGKSRLVEELALESAERGWHLAVGKCFQDEGAPPLWPWMSVLDALDLPFQPPDPDVAAGGLFRVRSEIVRLIREAALSAPLLLVLEDLHWADPSTLRVLRLLAESVAGDRLLVVVTWRTHEDPSSDLRAVAEALARRHAVRRDLSGLDESATEKLFEEISGRGLASEDATALYGRTEGNPFFVVELARLARDDDREIQDLIGPETLPTAVQEIVERRFSTLPKESAAALRAAAVIGHSFDLETLGDVTRVGPEELLQAVEPALDAGLLEEDAAEVFRFSHALVGDVLRASLSTTRLSRTHRLVAELLEQRPGREAEVAWHWREAGPKYVDRAWRAAASAADSAAALHAYGDAADLLGTALALQARDSSADSSQELDLLQQAIDAYRWASMLPELVGAVERSIEVAERAGDVARLAYAATQTTHRMGWRSAPYGSVNEVVIGALQRAIDELPEHARELRARALVSLASELREEETLEERGRLCEAAIELARSVDEPRLLCDVLILSSMARWGSPNTERILAASVEAADLASEIGDRHAHVMARLVSTVAYGELGAVDRMWKMLHATRKDAADLRVVYAELTLDELELAWLAAGGRFAECEELLADTQQRLALVTQPADGEQLSLDGHFDLFTYRLWQGRPLEALPGMRARIDAGLPMQIFEVVALWRAGRHEQSAARYEPTELRPLLEREMGFSSALRCGIAEASLYFDDADLARGVYDALLPYEGRSSGADGLFFGPVDAFLAIAARASGRTKVAATHADNALAIMDEWNLPAARTWFAGLRATFKF